MNQQNPTDNQDKVRCQQIYPLSRSYKEAHYIHLTFEEKVSFVDGHYDFYAGNHPSRSDLAYLLGYTSVLHDNGQHR